jgi:hypothetical protein
MMIMRLPQQGHGCAVVDGSVGPLSSGTACGFGTASSSQARKVFRAGRLGQKSVVTDAMEALWQDVVEESADKLTCCERHHFVARSTVAR